MTAVQPVQKILLIDDDPLNTLNNVKGVIWFLDFTAGELARSGSNRDATHGLSMILECAAQAVDHVAQAMQGKGVKHA